MKPSLADALKPAPDTARDIPMHQLRKVAELPCDGIPRFVVRGSVMGFKVPYSVAYGEMFALEGGELRPATATEKACRIYTKSGMKRLAALNQLYYQSPGVARFIADKQAADRVARDLERQKEIANHVPTPEEKIHMEHAENEKKRFAAGHRDPNVAESCPPAPPTPSS